MLIFSPSFIVKQPGGSATDCTPSAPQVHINESVLSSNETVCSKRTTTSNAPFPRVRTQQGKYTRILYSACYTGLQRVYLEFNPLLLGMSSAPVTSLPWVWLLHRRLSRSGPQSLPCGAAAMHSFVASHPPACLSDPSHESSTSSVHCPHVNKSRRNKMGIHFDERSYLCLIHSALAKHLEKTFSWSSRYRTKE